MPRMLPARRPGPLERTVGELQRLDIEAAFRRGRVDRRRRRLRESDALLDLVEQCRVRGYRLMPGQLWSVIARFAGGVDAGLRDQLGIDRRPELAADVLFSAQALLLEDARAARRPALAPIIPLFPDAAALEDAGVV